MKQNIDPMQLLLSIVERGSAAKLMRQYEAFKITQHFQAFGHGTAASHLLDTLGFGTSERDILLSIAPKDTMRQLMYFLRDEGRSDLGAKGIACSLDLTALSAIYALGISRLEEMNPDKGEQLMEQGNQHTLILVAVNYGYTRCGDGHGPGLRCQGRNGHPRPLGRQSDRGEIRRNYLAG